MKTEEITLSLFAALVVITQLLKKGELHLLLLGILIHRLSAKINV